MTRRRWPAGDEHAGDESGQTETARQKTGRMRTEHADSELGRPEPTYRVGYGRPPIQHRFKPGRSGNPSGRPRKPRNTGQILAAILNAPMTVTEGGVERKLPRREIVFKVLVTKAMAGDVRATKLLLQAMQDHKLPVEDLERALTIKFVRPGQKDE